ncbi:MAG: hypothetical protein JXR42_02520 [Gammaproteobacteria bacterium]|nr:hypothetical protein [Gammaproteobacteria bacterium]
MSKQSQIHSTINQWKERGGNLWDMLEKFQNIPITNSDDAVAIVNALNSLSFEDKSNDTEEIYQVSDACRILVTFFQQADSQEVFNIFVNQGLSQLRRIFTYLVNQPDSKNEINLLMFILRLLAEYRQEEDARLIAKIARSGFQSNNHMWENILHAFTVEHPYCDIVINTLAVPLPKDFLGIVYLDVVNDLVRNGFIKKHPFDTESGIEYLRELFLSKTNFSYAHSAAASLPFLTSFHREGLIQLAKQHIDPYVHMESAWAMATIGDYSGVELLKKMAVDARYSNLACQYLKGLGCGNKIPTIVFDDDFKAMVEASDWLDHPQEYGKVPDEISLYDTRALYWPPTDDERKVWLFKYIYKGDKDVEASWGFVMVGGSTTFSLFGEYHADFKAEDVYGVHCVWELEVNEDARMPESRNAKAGLAILRQYNPSF